MVNIILSKNEQYSFKYDSNKSIKEILDDFFHKMGFLSDIYEAYDPVQLNSLDTSKELCFYDIDSLYLRRVDSSMSSHEQLSNYDDKNWNSMRTLSQNSYHLSKSPNEILEKKNKKGIISKLKKRFGSKKHHIDRSYSTSVVPQLGKQFYAASTDDLHHKIHQEESIKPKPSKKMKRHAPNPPDKQVINLHFEDFNTKSSNLDIELPPPPSISIEFPEEISYYPWQHHIEINMVENDFIEEIIYATLPEDPFPLTVSEYSNIETPIFHQPINSNEDHLENTNYVYAKIQKNKIPKDKEDSDNSSVDTPKPYLKPSKVIPKNRNKTRANNKHNHVKVTITNPADIDSQLKCANNSPDLDLMKQLTISEKNKSLNTPIICIESTRSSTCSIVSDEIFEADVSFSTPNSDTLSQSCSPGINSEIQLSSDDKEISQFPINTIPVVSTEKENVHILQLSDSIHLPVQHKREHDFPDGNSEAFDKSKKSQISNPSMTTKCPPVKEKPKSKDRTNGLLENLRPNHQKPYQKRKDCQVEYFANDKFIKVEKHGKTLFISQF